MELLRAADAAQLKEVFFSGEPWLVQCGTKADISAAIVDDGFGAHAVVEKKLQRLKLEQEKMSQSSDQTIESPESSETLFGILKCPSLFLYSAGDALIPPEGVEQFAAARARRLGTVSSALSDGAGAGGGRVVLKKWESPKHVEIGRDDPDGYSKALMNFLNPQPAAERVNNIKPFIRANVDRENVKATETDVTNA